VVIGRFNRYKPKNRLGTKLYDKTADLNFPIGTLHLYNNIPAASAFRTQLLYLN
jgi:hypothetical protein